MSRSENVKNYAVAVSAALVPIVVATVGYWIQASISKEAIRKDYAQMAVSVLQQAPTEQNRDLRAWAVAILDNSAPVPLSPPVRTQLEQGAIGLGRRFSEEEMRRACPIELSSDPTIGRSQYEFCRLTAYYAGTGRSPDPCEEPYRSTVVAIICSESAQ